jgi:hypothetical protein
LYPPGSPRDLSATHCRDAVDRSTASEVYELHTFEYDGDKCPFNLRAVRSEDGRYVMMLTGISPVSSYDLLSEDAFPLIDRIAL